MPNSYVNDSNPKRGDAHWGENGLTSPLQYFVIVTVYSEPAIGNMSILLFKKQLHFFLHDKLNKYTYLAKILTMIQVIWESSQKNVSRCIIMSSIKYSYLTCSAARTGYVTL